MTDSTNMATVRKVGVACNLTWSYLLLMKFRQRNM